MVDKHGFIHEPLEIKLLILFVMQRLSEPVTMNELAELTMCDDAISYFDVTDCIDKLTKTKHLLLSEDKKYSLSAKGLHNGEILEKELPYSVKLKAESATKLVRSAQERNALIRTDCNKRDDGNLNVTLSLSDGYEEIVSINLFATDENQADTMMNGFRENAEDIYKAIIEMTTKKNKSSN